LRNRKLSSSHLAACSGSLGQALDSEKPGQHISPHQAVGRSKDQITCIGHL